jgi:uncharacterized protein YoaH (UPF0181 family)
MNNSSLSTKTLKEIEHFVSNIVIRSGLVSYQEMTCLEEVKQNIYQAKKEVRENIEQFKEDTKKFLKKLQLSSHKNDDFQEELKSHIKEHVQELTAQGISEEEAIKIVFTEFQGVDFSELNQMEGEEQMKYNEAMKHWKYDEAIGLFYGGFLFLGGAAGFIVGNMYNMMWQAGVTGIIAGIGLGCISHGLIALKR